MQTKQVHTPGHPCRKPPNTSLIVCNYSDRVKSRREMSVLSNMIKSPGAGVTFVNNNPALADPDGRPLLIGASQNGAKPLINENGNIGYQIDTTAVNTDPPETMDTTSLGALVARNAFAHVAGPLVRDSRGNVNYNLMLRGYNKGGLLTGRETDDYFGLDLMHDGTDGLMVLSSGSTSITSDIGTPAEKTMVNYEDGETVRIRMSGVDTAIASRTVTFEKRLTDSSEGGPAATWGPWFRLQ